MLHLAQWYDLRDLVDQLLTLILQAGCVLTGTNPSADLDVDLIRLLQRVVQLGYFAANLGIRGGSR